MASSRLGLISIGRTAQLTSFCFPSTASIVLQRRSIVNKNIFKEPEGYKEPWPYKKKGYTKFNWPWDFTKNRLHENSKLIVVEGNIGSGKATVATELADALGFYYMPEFKMEDILIDCYGNDLRNYYHLFPRSFRIPDTNMFYKNPNDINTARMQFRIFSCRFEQYLNALAHIMNTGQGVVLEGGFHTDFAFVNAMRSKNYISPEFFKFYFYVRKRAVPQLRYWPHLVIYLDTPIDKCLERIKARGNANEIAVVDGNYLQVLSDSYKDAMQEFKRHSKILIYDWRQNGTTDQIVEDIEKIDFDFFEWHNSEVFEEWHQPADEVWHSHYRAWVTQKWLPLINTFNDLPTHEVGELYTDINDVGHFLNTMKTQVLKGKYGYGYYPVKGDDKAGAMWAWQYCHHLPSLWFEYYWKDVYLHQLHSYESYVDPNAFSYNPDYIHNHH